ncbi:MAG: ABC transporter ATP-binding protein [Eubacteriales bacterium]|nr:ABC transporter ATP-binding protein [Eubacteriales bacterium]
MQNKEILLEVSHVNKEFPVKKQRLRAVSDVSFTLSRGELLGIVGESGCGKSTLAKMIVGSLPVSSGAMTLNGVDYTALKGKEKRLFRRNIQMVFQDPLSSFSPRMKIGTYLAEPRRNYDHIPKEQALDEAEELLEQVGLPRDFVMRYPHELSGGQLQRVAVARAIAIHPELLLCDEATGALDVSIQNQIAKLLVDLVEERNIGCIFIGHDLALVRSVSQRIAIMYMGKIVELVESEHLEAMCRHPYTIALIHSIFDVYCKQDEEVQLLQGEPPSPLKVQEGCPFAPRCGRCTQKCREAVPELRELEEGHLAACFHLE